MPDMLLKQFFFDWVFFLEGKTYLISLVNNLIYENEQKMANIDVIQICFCGLFVWDSIHNNIAKILVYKQFI